MKNIADKKERYSFFEDEACADAIVKAFRDLLAEKQKMLIAKFMRSENMQRLKHGGNFSHPGSPDAFPGDLQKQSSTILIKYDELIEHDLSAIERCLNSLSQDMWMQFQKMVYSTLSAACDKSGNSVDARSETSFKDAFEKALNMVEFVANKNGEVTIPELHMGTDVFNKMVEEMADASPEYNQRIEEIKERKTALAIENEVKRKTRFVQYGEVA